MTSLGLQLPEPPKLGHQGQAVETQTLFIKGKASDLFDERITKLIDGVKAYYDSNEKAVFFEVDGVVFNCHNIRLSDTIQILIRSAANKLIERPDIRLQKIPVELFDLALAS